MNESSNIVIHTDEIKATETFKSLSKIQQKIRLNRNSRIAIQNGVNIALNRGLEVWEKQTNGSHFHVEVVKELYKIKKSC